MSLLEGLTAVKPDRSAELRLASVAAKAFLCSMFVQGGSSSSYDMHAGS